MKASSVLVAVGLGWLLTDLYVVFERIILRDTVFGTVAQQIDRLPPFLATKVFMLFWWVFLLGWSIPLGFGLRLFFSKKRVSN